MLYTVYCDESYHLQKDTSSVMVLGAMYCLEDTLSVILDRCHEVFKQTIAAKDRPTLGEREIYVPLKWIEEKAEIFWHVASIEQKQGLNITPCNNDISSSCCDENCVIGKDTITLGNGDIRAKCIFRAVRIGWIYEIIDLYNDGDLRVRYWEKVNSDKSNRLYLRYMEEEIDYLVVFGDSGKKNVRLITAYPVFFINAKKIYEKDYQDYIKKPVIAVRKPESPSKHVR